MPRHTPWLRATPPSAAVHSKQQSAGELARACSALTLMRLVAGHGCEPPRARAPSDQVEPIKIHHLVPSSHEVTHELLLRVVTRVDLREGAELRVRAEDQVDR